MEIQTMPAINAICFSTKTSLKNLEAIVGTKAFALQAEATRLNLLISGPVYWFYFGADGKPDTEFTLEVVLPVSGKPAREISNPEFFIKRVPPFTYVSVLHNGDWEQLPGTYQKIIGEVFAKGYQMLPSAECRERYINIDFENKEANITEVMIGVTS